MDVELRHLRAFAAVASLQSYTAASRQLLITQPALTRTIQQLENMMGVKLLHRTSRYVEVTDIGQAFLDEVEGILNALDQAVLTAQGHRTLRLGFQWLLPDPWATDTIAEFELKTGTAVVLTRHDDITAKMRHGDIDVAVSRTRVESPGVVHTLLLEERRVAVVCARSQLASETSISWRDLARHPVVINTLSGTTQPSLWSPEDQPQEIVTCTNFDEWLQHVITGRGVGTLPESAARTGIHPGVAFVGLEDAPPVSIWLVYGTKREDALVRSFVDTAVNVRDRLR